MSEYIVIIAYAFGSPNEGYSIRHAWDYERFRTRKAAIRHGFKMRDSDDFNIGVVADGKLTSVDWMEKVVDDDPNELARIADEIGLGAEDS